jgi:hypothetical protein
VLVLVQHSLKKLTVLVLVLVLGALVLRAGAN